MRLIKNIGTDRVLDHVSPHLQPGSRVDAASDGLSLFGFDALARLLASAGPTRLLLSNPAPKSSRPVGMRPNSSERAPEVEIDPLAGGLLGDDSDRERRNALQARGLAADLLQWLDQAAQVRLVPGKLPQSAVITESASGAATENAVAGGVAITGDCSLTTRGLGLAPGNQFSLIQCSETEAERQMFAQWFEATWQAVGDDPGARQKLLDQVKRLADHEAPSTIYFGVLYNLFKDLGDELDEERIIKSATGTIEPGYPLAPHYVVHVSSDGAVQLPHSQAKQVLDRLKGLCLGRDLVDAQACERLDKATKAGRQMQPYQALLRQAIASVVGKSQERAVASLFSPGGTHAKKGEFAGIGDFEVVAFLVIV